MRRLVAAVALLGAGVATLAPAQSPDRGPAARPAGGVSLGVAVVPETVTVGDPFRVVVRVRAPRGASLTFPPAPDSGTGVEPLDPVAIETSADTSVVEQTATYRLAAWDVGARPIRFADLLLREPGWDDERRVAMTRATTVFVASVLPADSTERTPRPARALFDFGPPWWWWALVAVAAVALGVLLWWLWRRRRREAALPSRTPLEEAEAEFARIEALELVASGERGLHVALMVDVLRDYLARVLPGASPALTTSELLLAVRGAPRLPHARMARVLHDADLVKFAAAPIDSAHALALGGDARELAVAVDAALHAAVAPPQPARPAAA